MEKSKEMRSSSGLKMCLMVFLSVLLMMNTYAQVDIKYANKEITLQVKNENLDQVLDKISTLGNVHFFYNHSILDGKKKVTVDLINKVGS